MRELRRSPHVIWDRVDGVPSFCHTESVEFFRMNAIGNFIWDMCDGITPDEITTRLCAIYTDAEPERVRSEVSGFIEKLGEFGLIEWRDR